MKTINDLSTIKLQEHFSKNHPPEIVIIIIGKSQNIRH